MVFFNGYTLHRSLPNNAPAGRYRRALVNHYMSAESFLPWRYDADKTMGKQDYRGIVMVAGSDLRYLGPASLDPRRVEAVSPDQLHSPGRDVLRSSLRELPDETVHGFVT